MARGKRTTPAYWREHFAAQQASGLRIADYLREEGIRSGQWYFWRKKLQATDNATGTTLIPITIQPTLSSRADVRVHLPNGIAVTWGSVESPIQLLQALVHLESS